MDRNAAPDEADDEMEEDFSPGDGVASREATVVCPYCGEAVEISLDPGSGPIQQYVEDCEICCQPWTVDVRYGAEGEASVTVSALD